jgi:hypothetical protein
MAEGVPRRGAENAKSFIAAEGGLSAEALAEVERGMAQMRKVYDGTEGAQAPDANA